jgi:hypothetical protein
MPVRRIQNRSAELVEARLKVSTAVFHWEAPFDKLRAKVNWAK